VTTFEAARRAFKQQSPGLYHYIAAVEAAKVLDSAGDRVSGLATGHAAATTLWLDAGAYKSRSRGMAHEAMPT
jgi:hypothetical protein